MRRKSQYLAEAKRLDELAVQMEKAADLLRDPKNDAIAYTVVYQLRRELGYVARDMGSQYPGIAAMNRVAQLLEE